MGYIEISVKLKTSLIKQNATEVKSVFDNMYFKIAFYNSDIIYDMNNYVKPVSKRVESKNYSYLDFYKFEKKSVFLQKFFYGQDNNLLTKTTEDKIKHLTLSDSDSESIPMWNRLNLNDDFK